MRNLALMGAAIAALSDIEGIPTERPPEPREKPQTPTKKRAKTKAARKQRKGEK